MIDPMPSAEQIIGEVLERRFMVNHEDAPEVIQALSDAGKIIVDQKDLETVLSEGLSEGGRAFVSKALRGMSNQLSENIGHLDTGS